MQKQDIKSLVLLVIVFAILLRFTYAERDFWHDEAFQLLYAEKPISYIIDSNDVHPPLFALFAKALIQINDSIFFLRFAMIFISMLFLWAFYSTIKEIFDSKVAFYSLLFIAVIPTYTYYSSEFRPYIFVLLFAVLQIKYLNRLLIKSSWQNSTMFVILSLVMLYSHYLTGLLLLSEALYATLVRKVLWKEYLLIGLICVPLVTYLIDTLPKIQSFWFNNIDFTSLISTFVYLIIMPTKTSIGLSVFVYGLIILGLIKYRHEIDKRLIQFMIYLVLPIITMWVISISFFPMYHHRYFLFGGISIFVLMGWATSQLELEKKDYELAVIAFFAVFIIFSQRPVLASLNTELIDSSLFLYNYTGNNTEDYILIHTSPFSQSPYKVYYPNRVNLLKTNLSRANLFTAGGSVIEDYEIIRTINNLTEDIRQYHTYFKNHSLYLVSDRAGEGEIIYDKGGLYITKLK